MTTYRIAATMRSQTWFFNGTSQFVPATSSQVARYGQRAKAQKLANALKRRPVLAAQATIAVVAVQ